ncbi:MAG: hypothetical protein Q9M30_03600 [Mariprofundaceae bacterium]|nr:hypothetical protein [Mariprofundaceae bacterium]
MKKEYACMHDRQGYFIGRRVMGQIKRLSLEYFPDESSCVQAIRARDWTPRTAF